MVGFRDEIATQVMGEVDETLKKVDEQMDRADAIIKTINEQIAQTNEAAREMVVSAASITRSVENYKAVHTKHIADLLEASKTQMDAVDATQRDAFIKCAASTSQAVMADIAKNAEAVKAQILKSVGDEAVQIVRDRVSKENTSLSEASTAYKKLTADFESVMVQRHKDAFDAVKRFDQSLQDTIAKRAPMGWFGQGMWLYISSVMGAGTIILSVNFGWLELPQAPLTSAQQSQITDGLLLEKVWPKLSDKEKADLQKKWKQE